MGKVRMWESQSEGEERKINGRYEKDEERGRDKIT